jgi:hypothetical protein
LCFLFQRIVKLWSLFEWRWVNGLIPIKGFCEVHLCFVIVSTVSILRYWDLIHLWYISLVFYEVITQSIPRLYATMAFILVREDELPWLSWIVTLLVHSRQPNEFFKVKFGIHMVYFSGFLWSHCMYYSKTVWYHGD